MNQNQRYTRDDSFPIKQGGNGQIQIVRNEKGELFAMKTFTKNQEQYLHEINLCNMLKRHINIVDIVETITDGDQRILIMEYCDKNLMEYLLENNPPESERIHLFVQIASAFQQIHQDLKTNNMVFQHRDIKPDNIMLGKNNTIKIIDFGESRLRDKDEDHIPTMKTGICGTPGYMDPVMLLLGEGFQPKSDIWSLGVTFYQILFNKILDLPEKQIRLQSRKQKDRKSFIIKEINDFIQNTLNSQEMSLGVRKLLQQMLCIEIDNRYGWEELFQDPLLVAQLEQQLILNQQYIQTPTSTPIIKRKKLIKLSQQLDSEFLSINFMQKAGTLLAESYYMMISKGQHCIIAAEKLMKLNQQEYSQVFEKCNYLLHLRSLIILNSYNQILSQKIEIYGNEKIEKQCFIKMVEDQELNERIQLQVYYLFENVRKMMQGNGLESRILQLHQDEELQFEPKERFYFSYTRNDQKLNRPEYFDDQQFMELFRFYISESIKKLWRIDTIESYRAISDLIVCYGLNGFYHKCTISRLFQYNQQLINTPKKMMYARLKVCCNSFA